MAFTGSKRKTGQSGEQKINRVREILMGREFKEIETRLNDLQQNIRDNHVKASADLTRLKVYFESFTDEKTEQLNQKITQLKHELDNSNSRLEEKLEQFRAKVDKQFEEIDQKVEKAVQNNEKYKNELQKNIDVLSKEFNAKLDKQLSELQEKMVVKNNLATLLSQLSDELNKTE